MQATAEEFDGDEEREMEQSESDMQSVKCVSFFTIFFLQCCIVILTNESRDLT